MILRARYTPAHVLQKRVAESIWNSLSGSSRSTIFVEYKNYTLHFEIVHSGFFYLQYNKYSWLTIFSNTRIQRHTSKLYTVDSLITWNKMEYKQKKI